MMSWIPYVLGSAFFAALVAVFGKIGIAKVDTALDTTVRAVIMAAFLAVVSAALQKSKLLGTIDRRAWLFIPLSGLAGAALVVLGAVPMSRQASMIYFGLCDGQYILRLSWRWSSDCS